TPCPILDSEDRVTAFLAGQPRGQNWKGVVEEAASRIEETRGKVSFTKKQVEHGRGDFPAISAGFAHGGGRQKPGNVCQSSAAVLVIITTLLAATCFQRISGFANTAFQLCAPNVFEYYLQTVNELTKWNPALYRPFLSSAWATCTVNFGPVTVSQPHRDSANLAFGWCAITALGQFDPDRGGHLILWDLGLMIRFPPGSTILIPSALVTHSNTPIQKGETRYSFVQYSAAGLFRWVYNNFMTDEDFRRKASETELAQREEDRKKRWLNGVQMFSKWSEIVTGVNGG
ncbi:hypothetical protein K435DRAFT_688889, partial [Dendrothele bispora CBS 962.96]